MHLSGDGVPLTAEVTPSDLPLERWSHGGVDVNEGPRETVRGGLSRKHSRSSERVAPGDGMRLEGGGLEEFRMGGNEEVGGTERKVQEDFLWVSSTLEANRGLTGKMFSFAT